MTAWTVVDRGWWMPVDTLWHSMSAQSDLPPSSLCSITHWAGMVSIMPAPVIAVGSGLAQLAAATRNWHGLLTSHTTQATSSPPAPANMHTVFSVFSFRSLSANGARYFRRRDDAVTTTTRSATDVSGSPPSLTHPSSSWPAECEEEDVGDEREASVRFSFRLLVLVASPRCTSQHGRA